MSRLQTMKDNIRHDGIIERIEGNTIYVRILQQSACAGCHARAMCSASESKIKIIEITDHTGQYRPEDKVHVCGRSSLGLRAVLLAFVFPIIGVIGMVATGLQLGWEESVSALAGLMLLAPYYFILYLMRNKLKRTFVFTLEKQKNL